MGSNPGYLTCVAQDEARGSAPISRAHIFTPGTWPKVCDAVDAKV